MRSVVIAKGARMDQDHVFWDWALSVLRLQPFPIQARRFLIGLGAFHLRRS